MAFTQKEADVYTGLLSSFWGNAHSVIHIPYIYTSIIQNYLSHLSVSEKIHPEVILYKDDWTVELMKGSITYR